MKQLLPWNPLDYARLLYWTLAVPRRLLAHREAFGRHAEHSLSKWLCSTFFWLPCIIPVLAMSIGAHPTYTSPTGNRWFTAFLIVLWVLYAVVQQQAKVGTSIVYGFGMSVAILSRLYIRRMFPTWADTLDNPGGILVFITRPTLAILLASALNTRITKKIQANVNAVRPSRMVQGATAVILLLNAFFLWYSFLGGWQIFK